MFFANHKSSEQVRSTRVKSRQIPTSGAKRAPEAKPGQNVSQPATSAWAAGAVFLVRDRVTVGRLELVMIGTLFAFVGWVALSALWTASLPSTVLEVERDVVYPAGALAAAAVFDRQSSRHLLGAICAAITLVSWYALATRIFPDRVATFDAFGGYRLFRPIGYWNALGLFAAMGMLLALGFAARGRQTGTRLLAAASLVVLAPTLYFTYSRGAWIALAYRLRFGAGWR